LLLAIGIVIGIVDKSTTPNKPKINYFNKNYQQKSYHEENEYMKNKLYRQKSHHEENEYMKNKLYRQKSENEESQSSWDGMPKSSYYHPITTNIPSVVETEDKLLKMALKPRLHPQPIFSSHLRSLGGNPIVGDVIIKPRRSGVSIPLQAQPDDLAIGYFA
jgi:hypothetical protein